MKSRDELLNWYEAELPTKERKRRGHFSTPPLLVERILDACGYTPESDLTQVRVLDPACGGGNFLAAAARHLIAFITLRWGGNPCGRPLTLIQRNLWGFDPDPIACFLAEMQLYTALDEPQFCRGGGGVGLGRDHVLDTSVLYNGRPPSLHIHQADALALTWEPCVDLFLANPPYLAAKNSDLSGYHSTQRRGQADSYLLFLELALQVVRPGGWIGLVLPDPILARANASRERTRLLKEATIHHLWHLSGVFSAEVGAVVIIAQKNPSPPTHQISWVRGKWQREDHQSELVTQSLFLRQPRAELRYLLSCEHGTAVECLRSHFEDPHSTSPRLASLSDFLSISRGEELGKNSPYLTPSIVPRRGALCGRPVSTTDDPDTSCCPAYPILLGGSDIRPYRIPSATHYIAPEAIEKPLERYLTPKLLVVKSTDRLQATLDTRGHIALQTLYLLHLDKKNMGEDGLYFFLALLNSRLLQKYVYMLHTAYKWVLPQIEQSVLARLPVPIVKDDERRPIIELSRRLAHACSAGEAVVEWNQPISSMYEEQERAIYSLYASVLPELFTDAELFTPGRGQASPVHIEI